MKASHSRSQLIAADCFAAIWKIVSTIFQITLNSSDLNSSRRALAVSLRRDLGRKLVVLTGARQAGKATLARQLMADFEPAQYLNWDVPADRQLITQQAWSPKARLVVFDEIHKMRDWKAFLKGAWDGRSKGQAMLVTGSARMETFRQGGESLAGRCGRAGVMAQRHAAG